MTGLQKEYCEEKGLIYIKPENTEIADYVNWLEAQIQALRIHDVSGRSEQLVCPECLSNRVLEYKDKYQCRQCWNTWTK